MSISRKASPCIAAYSAGRSQVGQPQRHIRDLTYRELQPRTSPVVPGIPGRLIEPFLDRQFLTNEWMIERVF